MSLLSLGGVWKRGAAGAVILAILLVGCSKKSESPEQPNPQTNNASAQPPPAPEPEAPGPNAGAKEYVDFGAANGARGDLDAAVTAFNSAISLDPKFPPAYYNLGYAKSLQNKPDEAIQDYSQAIQLDPNYRDAYDQRGILKGEQGDFAGAIPDFQQVIRIDPKYAEAHYSLGHVYYFTADLDNATKELDQALALDPKLSTAYYIRGLIRHAQGHNADATSDFRKSLGFDFSSAAFWIFICETEDGLRDAADKDLAEALSRPEVFKPDDFPTAVGNFLLGHLSQDDLVAKATTSKDNVRVDYTCEAWFYAGIAQRFDGNKAGATDCFKKAIATDSKGSEEYVEAKREIAALSGP